MGCVRGQHDETSRKEHVIYYLSKKFIDCEQRYSSLERTCCALAWAAHRLRQYMISHTTWLISKMDQIKYIFEKPALTGRIARWQMLLSEYDILYVTQKAIKGSALADFLAHQLVEDYQPMLPDFSDEDISALFHADEYNHEVNTWTLFFDCTNNIVKYEACAIGIRAVTEYRVKILEVYGDSALVVHQIKGEWETRDQKLIPHQAYIKGLMEYFDAITFHHIPREDNQLADALATLSSMFEVNQEGELPTIKMKSHEHPAYCNFIEEEPDGKPWYFDIKRYLQSREYPESATENDKRMLRRLASGFVLNGEVLYKRNHDMILLRCVEAKEAELILQEVELSERT